MSNQYSWIALVVYLPESMNCQVASTLRVSYPSPTPFLTMIVHFLFSASGNTNDRGE